MGDSPLRRAIEDARKNAVTVTVYAADRTAAEDVRRLFGTRNTKVEHRRLPSDEPFLVVRNEAGFVGAVALTAVDRVVSPSPPTLGTPPDEDVRALLSVFADVGFASFDRHQLLVVSREIENLAWRVGTGELHTGFHAADAFRAQADGYERMAVETALDLHVYLHDPWRNPPKDGLTVHAELGGEIGEFWFVLYDGGGDRSRTYALVAEERAPNEFYGCWTYDAEHVESLIEYVRATDG